MIIIDGFMTTKRYIGEKITYDFLSEKYLHASNFLTWLKKSLKFKLGEMENIERSVGMIC